MRLFRTILLWCLTLMAAPTVYAAVSEDVCRSVVSDLGLPTEPYRLKSGWVSEKHVFGENTECFDRRGHVFVKSDGEVFAEDGFFGKAALEARDSALALQESLVDELAAERDQEIAASRQKYRRAVNAVKLNTEQQLREIRDGNVPGAVAEVIAEKKAAEVAQQEAEAERRKAEAERREAKLAANASEEAEKRRKGFHCLSGWSGSHRGVVALVKSLLNDPGSFKHEETLVAPVDGGRHRFAMKYRAKNGFGALIVSRATGSYSHERCDDIELESAQ